MKNINMKKIICGVLIGLAVIIIPVALGEIRLVKVTPKKTVNVDNKVSDSLHNANINNTMYDETEYETRLDELDNEIGDDEIRNDNIKNEADDKALDIMTRTGNWNYVKPLFSSMTPQGVKAVVDLYVEKTGNCERAKEALPYMNKKHSNENVSNKFKDKSYYDKLANETMTKSKDINQIMSYIPYMSTNVVDRLVKDYIKKTNDFNCIYSIREYMSTNGIDDTVKIYVDKTKDYGTVAAMLQFMSPDGSNYIAKKYINESKDGDYKEFFIPYLKS